MTPIVVEGKRIGARPGVRGDYQMFVLLTDLRRMDAATVRWDHVDLDEGRRAENGVMFKDGAAGWVFPTRALKAKPCALCAAIGQPSHDSGAVIHVVEGKQQRVDKDTGKATRILPSPHRLRDAYTSALAEVGGISPFMIDVLTPGSA